MNLKQQKTFIHSFLTILQPHERSDEKPAQLTDKMYAINIFYEEVKV